ncbi:hypothetical protein [Porcipelethomonas sp.]|uniref:hypothetical protein n=1 Tax=Porcipelethomonas sp. TaxID=2981675 RepID=UPI003EF5DE31
MAMKQMTRIQKIRYYAAIRWAIYILLVLVSAVLINIGKGVKPIYFIPLCVCICMNEGEYPAAFLGGICGLLLDEATGKIFGYSSILFIVFCVATTILFRHLLFQNAVNVIALSAVYTFIYQMLDYFFYYAMWGYEGSGYVFSDIALPCVFYTIMISPVVYLIIKPIVKRFYPKKAKNIEEAMKI